MLGAIKPLRSLVANYFSIVWHSLERTNNLFDVLYPCWKQDRSTRMSQPRPFSLFFFFFFFFFVEKLQDTAGTWKGTYLLFLFESSLSVYKHLWIFRSSKSNFPRQAYTQTVYVRNIKYKQYPIWQTTLTHN